jgi:hypothetical protein
LLEAWLKILAFLLLFVVLGKNFVRVILVALSFGIGVCDSNIDDTIHSMGPKATYGLQSFMYIIVLASKYMTVLLYKNLQTSCKPASL